MYPSAFVSAARVKPVASFLAVTAAPTIPAPVESLTTPWIVPEVACENAQGAKTSVAPEIIIARIPIDRAYRCMSDSLCFSLRCRNLYKERRIDLTKLRLEHPVKLAWYSEVYDPSRAFARA